MEISKYTDMIVMYASEYGLKIIAALLIFIVGKWAVGKLTLAGKKLMEKAKVDQTLVEFGESLIYFVLLLVVVLASLNTLGINTTSFIAIFGAAGLAIGLALKVLWQILGQLSLLLSSALLKLVIL